MLFCLHSKPLPVLLLNTGKEIAVLCNILHLQGTPSWCFHFMKWPNLSICSRSTVLQQLPDDYQEKLMLFCTYCTNKINNQKIQLNHITNVDEVPLTFDIPVNRTVKRTGTSAVSIWTTGNEKSFLLAR